MQAASVKEETAKETEVRMDCGDPDEDCLVAAAVDVAGDEERGAAANVAQKDHRGAVDDDYDFADYDLEEKRDWDADVDDAAIVSSTMKLTSLSAMLATRISAKAGTRFRRRFRFDSTSGRQ